MCFGEEGDTSTMYKYMQALKRGGSSRQGHTSTVARLQHGDLMGTLRCRKDQSRLQRASEDTSTSGSWGFAKPKALICLHKSHRIEEFGAGPRLCREARRP